jgi:hypothetical protein
MGVDSARNQVLLDPTAEELQAAATPPASTSTTTSTAPPDAATTITTTTTTTTSDPAGYTSRTHNGSTWSTSSNPIAMTIKG